jgi:hypothetical protein
MSVSDEDLIQPEPERDVVAEETQTYLDALSLKFAAFEDEKDFADAAARVLLRASEIVEEAHGVQLGGVQQTIGERSIGISGAYWLPHSTTYWPTHRTTSPWWEIDVGDAVISPAGSGKSYAILNIAHHGGIASEAISEKGAADTTLGPADDSAEAERLARSHRLRIFLAVGLATAVMVTGVVLLVAAAATTFRPNPYIALSLVLGGAVLLATANAAIRDTRWIR